MSRFTLDSKNLLSSDSFGFIISYYMFDADNIEELSFDQFPDRMKLYFYYLDTEERKEFKATRCTDTGFIMAEFNGDRYVTDGYRNACAPFFYRDNIWSFVKTSGSMRFEMELAELTEEEDDDRFVDKDWEDDID